jgi:hypothetical protein
MKTRRPAQRLTLALPAEFVIFCANHHTTPETVLRGFIADVAGIINWAANPREDGYSSNGSDERDMAFAYFDRCGYGYLEAWAADSEGGNGNSEGTSRPLRGDSVTRTSSFNRRQLSKETPALRGRGREKHRGGRGV